MNRDPNSSARHFEFPCRGVESQSSLVGGIVDELDFESLDPGPIASGTEINGVQFDYDFGGASMVVADSYPTTSGQKFLGTDSSDVFIGGDSLLMSFSSRIGFGVYIISPDVLLDEDVVLTVGGQGTAGLVAADIVDTLSDGSFVWFLGVLSDTPFESVELTTSGDFFTFNLDDITIVATPEPSTMILFPALGAAGLGFRRWKSRPKKSSSLKKIG